MTAVPVRVRIPTQLRDLVGGDPEVGVEVPEGGTVADALAALERAHAGFAERILDGDGSLRRFVNVFVAEEDVRFLQGLATPLRADQVVSIVPAVAGGC
jgi:molybdopterin converting factor small subunit